MLEQAPQLRIAATKLPAGSEAKLQDELAQAHPNVTLFAIREVLEKVSVVLGRIGFGVRFLGGFTALAGLAILAGAVAAGASRRGREVALSKSLGMTRAQVAALFAVESALAGQTCGADRYPPTKYTVCAGGGSCSSTFGGTCAPVAADGAPCSDIDTGPRCLAPARCVSGTCTLPNASSCK